MLPPADPETEVGSAGRTARVEWPEASRTVRTPEATRGPDTVRGPVRAAPPALTRGAACLVIRGSDVCSNASISVRPSVRLRFRSREKETESEEDDCR